MDNPESPQHETVMDTGAEQLGRTYAQALLSAASNAGNTDTIVAQLNQIVDEFLKGSPQLSAAFASPRIDNDEKARIIDRVFGDDFDPLLLKFMKVMAARGRLGNLGAVRDGVIALHDDITGQVLAKVSTAVPLDDNTRALVTEQLGKALNRRVRLHEVVNANLIGGMVIRVGDTVFDNSVANRIDTIARRAKDGFSSKLLEKFDAMTSE